MSRGRLVAGGVVAAALLLWWTTGSLLVALLILGLVALAAGLAVVVSAWARPRPDPLATPVGTTTVDLTVAPSAAAPVRRALRTVLARPWVHGDGLLRVTAQRLDGVDALVWTPRGQQVAAPHLWVEWNPVDGAEVAQRRPLESLARELAEGYVEHGREQGVRRLAERTWVHLLVSDDVPLGRVVVTAAFSEPQQTPVAAACASTAGPLAPARGAGGGHPAGAGQQRRPELGPGGGRRVPGPVALATRVTAAVPKLRTLVAGAGPRATLVVEDAAGTRLTDTDLTRTVELGRDPAAGLVVDHPGVSWRHVRLSPERGGWTVTDLGSTNGTRVDGRRIDRPTRLVPGAELALGADGPRLRLMAAETDRSATTQVVAGH
ncbi:FHA domain-containing protein [Actinomycetospora sp. OC33-EN08]|uniref:FHA domain-containing protein n=1 Tax=Actinomycetospora aurantiaca TaxID=3129233 RepID=A0ABU8MTI2_9PSEU